MSRRILGAVFTLSLCWLPTAIADAITIGTAEQVPTTPIKGEGTFSVDAGRKLKIITMVTTDAKGNKLGTPATVPAGTTEWKASSGDLAKGTYTVEVEIVTEANAGGMAQTTQGMNKLSITIK